MRKGKRKKARGEVGERDSGFEAQMQEQHGIKSRQGTANNEGARRGRAKESSRDWMSDEQMDR